jgi:hypothetical protein
MNSHDSVYVLGIITGICLANVCWVIYMIHTT